MRAFVRDERGASIVMALVFFLICAIIGSIVVTAASVSAKEVQTHRQLQEAEFAVGSAAQMIGYEFSSAELTCGPNPTDKPVPADWFAMLELPRDFWDENGKAVMEARAAGTSITFPLTVDASLWDDAIADTVHGELTVDADLNIVVALSLDAAHAETSPYNLKVTVQCVPTYDSSGALRSFAYEPAVVEKTGGAS